MTETSLMVLTTLPDHASAEILAEQLISENLAACVNIMGEITSFYRWKGKIQHGTEYQLLIKTTRTRYPEVQAWIADHHPYEIPEILAIPVCEGHQDYLDWVNACTKK